MLRVQDVQVGQEPKVNGPFDLVRMVSRFWNLGWRSGAISGILRSTATPDVLVGTMRAAIKASKAAWLTLYDRFWQGACFPPGFDASCSPQDRLPGVDRLAVSMRLRDDFKKFRKGLGAVWISGLMLLLALGARGAVYCVGPSATGTGSGADWNNQKAWSSTPARGDTWYLAGGAYSPKVFNTPDNGTYITILKASGTNHFTDTGWQASYGTQQASWTASSAGETQIEFDTGHWIFDGSYRNDANWFDGNSYGFAITNQNMLSGGPMVYFHTANLFSNILVAHIHSKGGFGQSSDPEWPTFHYRCDTSYSTSPNSSSWYITARANLTEAGTDSYETFGANFGGTVEYCAIWGAQGSANNHGNAIQFFWDYFGCTIRYNILRDCYNGAYPGTIASGGSAPISVSYGASVGGQCLVYGNVLDGLGADGMWFQPCSSAWGTGGIGYNEWIFNNTIVTRPGDSAANGICLDVSGSGNRCYNNLLVSVTGRGTGISGVGDFQNNVVGSDTSVFVNYAARDLRLARSVGTGTSIAAPFNVDLNGVARGANGNWDIGAYQSGATTNPVIQVSPNALSFGPVLAGTSVTNSFTVQNVGGGTLSGMASVTGASTNFLQILSGGTYSLGAGQSQLVTLRYSPTTNGTDNGTVSCSGSGGAQVSATGSLLPRMSGLSFPSYAGVITVPFTTNSGGYISQSVDTGISGAGQALYGFSVPTAGSYVVLANVNAPNGGANSFYVNIDALPTDPTMIWDVPVTTGFANQMVSWRGNGVLDTNSPSGFDAQFSPQVFNLSAGTHQLIVVGREANTQLGQITIQLRPPVPQNLRVVGLK
jgi:hypothetical protein